MNMENIQKIGIMGGTFDPIHYGHLMIAENAREQFHLDKILFIPTGHAPHKQERYVTDAFHRCQMVAMAIADNEKFLLDKIELNSSEVSYTYLTVKKLKEYYKNAELYFILGADSLFDFESWKEPKAIIENCKVLAACRFHEYQEKFFPQIEQLNEKYPGKFFTLHTPNLEISSHDIRKRVQMEQTIRYLVPNEVEAYIREHHLYEKEMSEHEAAGNREKIKERTGL